MISMIKISPVLSETRWLPKKNTESLRPTISCTHAHTHAHSLVIKRPDKMWFYCQTKWDHHIRRQFHTVQWQPPNRRWKSCCGTLLPSLSSGSDALPFSASSLFSPHALPLPHPTDSIHLPEGLEARAGTLQSLQWFVWGYFPEYAWKANKRENAI